MARHLLPALLPTTLELWRLLVLGLVVRACWLLELLLLRSRDKDVGKTLVFKRRCYFEAIAVRYWKVQNGMSEHWA